MACRHNTWSHLRGGTLYAPPPPQPTKQFWWMLMPPAVSYSAVTCNHSERVFYCGGCLLGVELVQEQDLALECEGRTWMY